MARVGTIQGADCWTDGGNRALRHDVSSAMRDRVHEARLVLYMSRLNIEKAMPRNLLAVKNMIGNWHSSRFVDLFDAAMGCHGMTHGTSPAQW
jgi:hypothetical protein